MSGATATPEFTSQMRFLKTYSDSFEQKKELRAKLQVRLEQIKPVAQEASEIRKEIGELDKSIRLDESFLINMNEMVKRNTGESVTDGPLFEKQAEAEKVQ
jgi:hypothetical protein